jgi:hypothetical protein
VLARSETQHRHSFTAKALDVLTILSPNARMSLQKSMGLALPSAPQGVLGSSDIGDAAAVANMLLRRNQITPSANARNTSLDDTKLTAPLPTRISPDDDTR